MQVRSYAQSAPQQPFRQRRIADAHRGDGRRFIVRADEKLTAFMELESAIHRPDPHKAES
jgi:hypothetical protein